MHFIYIIIGLLLFCELSFSQPQKLKRLYSELANSNIDSSKVLLMIELSKSEDLHLDERIRLTNKALNISNSSNYKKGIALSYLSLIHIMQLNKKEMEHYGEKAIQYFKELKEDALVGNTLHDISAFYLYKGGDYLKALEYANMHIDYSKLRNKNLSVYRSWNLIGEIYRVTKNYEKSLEAYENAISTNTDPSYISPHINIGTVFLNTNKYHAALNQYDKSLNLLLNNDQGRSQTNAYILNRTGQIYLKQKEYEKAKELFEKSLKVYRELNVPIGIVLTTSSMSKLYHEVGITEHVLQYGEEAIEIAVDIGYISEGIDEICLIVSESHKRLKNYKKAYEYNLIYNMVRDSLFGPEKNIAMAHQQIQLETEKQQSQNQLLEKKKELDQELILRQNIIYGVAIVLVVFLVLMVLYLYRNNTIKNKLNKTLSKQQKQITSQSKLLEKSNIEVQNINEELEQKIALRTKELESQLQRITKYAFINAHHLRAPLARILGLIYLMEMEMTAENITGYMLKLKQASSELELVVNEINNMLSDESIKRSE